MGSKRIGLARVEALIENLKRDLSLNQSTLKGVKSDIIECSEATTLTANQSGATISWTHSASNHNLTLPAAKQGLRFRFVIAVGHAAEHDILAVGSDKIIGRVNVLSTTADKTDTQIGNKGDNFVKINLHATTTTLGGDIGDTIELVCLEDGFWTCSAQLTLRTGSPSGTAVLTT